MVDGFLKNRSSRPVVFCKKGVLRNFTKFTGKHLCQSLFFNKVSFLKKRLWHRRFPVNFAKFLRTPFLTEHFLICDPGTHPVDTRHLQDIQELSSSYLV